ncbi:LppA family lipoprotein [Mycobacterium sp. ACS4331]|uniref:LppA family lipoprotein n=1 Tax=Mycobacterium sp. ACS4331 TaxID=1834121 RepID=UPI000AD61ECE|nr:LppA family lipoprotein [Mycobacterium sp. ACS4331]
MLGAVLRTVLATGTALAVLTACGEPESPILNKDAIPMNLRTLPTLKQTQNQMLDLIEAVRVRIAAEAPQAGAWHWADGWSGSGCTDDAGDSGIALYFPDLTAKYGLSTAEWDRVLPAVTALAAEAGLTEVAMPQNSETNHDARFTSGDGRELLVGSSVATVITARISCRREAGDPIDVDGVIPMPPDPA